MSNIDKYADIIDLPRPKMRHTRMSPEARAGQFAPFAALVGFYDLVQKESHDKLEEVATEEMVEVDIDAQIEIDEEIVDDEAMQEFEESDFDDNL